MKRFHENCHIDMYMTYADCRNENFKNVYKDCKFFHLHTYFETTSFIAGSKIIVKIVSNLLNFKYGANSCKC